MELTSLFVSVAGGEDGGVARQQFDRQRFDPPHQRHRQPWAFDGHHPRDRRHSATVLKQPADTRDEDSQETDDRKDGGKKKGR